MSKLLDKALDKLKDKIVKIKDEAMQHNTEGLDQLSDSVQSFVNPDLLPPEIADTFKPGNSRYSNNVLQAVWNIADILRNAGASEIMKLIKNQDVLTENFAYLNANWVPNVIDSKTYRTAKALLDFINNVLKNIDEIFNENPLSYIPNLIAAPIKNNIKNELDRLRTSLTEQIEIYETYPEKLKLNLSSQKKLFDLKLERENSYNSLIKGNISNLRNNISDNKKAHRLPLDSLLTNLKVLEEQRDLLKKKFEEFKQSNADRLDQNKNFVTIESTVFFNTLYNYQVMHEANMGPLPILLQNDFSDNIINQWQSGRALKAQDIDVHKALTQFDVRESKSVNDLLKEADDQIKILQEKILATKDLEIYTQSTDSKLEQKLAPMIDRPSCIITVDGIPSLQIQESQSEDKETALKENIKAYGSSLPEDLKSYPERLIAYRQYLEAQLSILQKEIVIPEALSAEFKQYYQNIPNALFAPKIQQVNEELALAKELLQAAKEKKHSFELDLAKMSDQGRQKVLSEGRNRIQKAIKAQYEAWFTEINVVAQHSDFIQQQYEPAIKSINSNYDPEIDKLNKQINSTKEGIKKLEATTKSRRSFLVEAKEKLNDFSKTLKNSTGIYIQADKIPQKELLQYLELNPESEEAKEIAEMYSIADVGKSWYGINLSNLSNRFSAYASIGVNSFVLNQIDLEKTIDKKIKQIAEELKNTDLNVEVEKPKNIKNLNEYNLYTLPGLYQKQIKELEEQTKSKEELSAAKQTEIDGWNGKKSEKDQQVIEFKLNNQLEIMNNQFAMIAFERQNLEYKLDAIEEKLSASFEDSDSIADLFETQQNSLKLIRDVLSIEKPTELQKTISAKLANQHRDLESLEKFKQSNLPEPIQEKYESLENELKSLDTKNSALEKKIITIDEKILATKLAIEQLSKLAKIEKVHIEQTAKMIEFIETKPSEATWVQASQTIDDRLEEIREDNKEFFNQCKESQDQRVQKALRQLDTLDTKLQKVLEEPVFNEEIEQNEEPFDFKEDKEPAVFPKLIIPIKQQINKLDESYFGENKEIKASNISGKFGEYLTQRAEVHWFKDWFSGLAAIVFGIEYKTPAQERTEYLVELSQKMKIFLDRPGHYTFEVIVEKIEEGQKKFSPEAETGESYDNSLSELLSSLKVEFESMKAEPHKELTMAEPVEEEDEVSSIKPR